jgi:peptide/nickel transport system substrate-binding protein
MKKTIAGILGATVALALSVEPVAAQKAQDTLRMAVTDWWSTLDPYHFPQDEAAVFYRAIYETLVGYDERQKKFVPRLAKAWKRLDNRTIEFELRDDVKWHNGDKFTADDVLYTIAYIGDPKVPIRFKDRYNWIETAEKLDDYKVRITSKQAFATDLQMMAYRINIYNARVHKALESKSDYGRTAPVTTGPYKVVSLDATKMVLERFDGHYDKSQQYYRAPVKRVLVRPIPDRQTQVAEFLTGGVDLIRNVTADTARELAKMPELKVTRKHNGMLMYVTLDAAGRSDNKAMMDQRVRKAFMMAVNRAELAKTVIPGGEPSDILDAICIPSNVGCTTTTKPPEFDPEGAKKLLAEAGYPNGFDLEFNVFAPIKEIGEAIAGQVRNVGIRTSVRPLPLALYVQLRGQGKFTAFNGFYPTNAQPDIDNIFDFFFGQDRDYWQDPIIKEAQAKGYVEFDDEKRTAIYLKGIDQVNKMNYILPVADLPMVFVHNKTVHVDDNPLSAVDSRIGDYGWAK